MIGRYAVAHWESRLVSSAPIDVYQRTRMEMTAGTVSSPDKHGYAVSPARRLGWYVGGWYPGVQWIHWDSLSPDRCFVAQHPRWDWPIASVNTGFSEKQLTGHWNVRRMTSYHLTALETAGPKFTPWRQCNVHHANDPCIQLKQNAVTIDRVQWNSPGKTHRQPKSGSVNPWPQTPTLSERRKGPNRETDRGNPVFCNGTWEQHGKVQRGRCKPSPDNSGNTIFYQLCTTQSTEGSGWTHGQEQKALKERKQE